MASRGAGAAIAAGTASSMGSAGSDENSDADIVYLVNLKMEKSGKLLVNLVCER